ncbi:RNA exonuclease 4 [Orchesella cincta]|uniref:RNA exonuclease 4 n=1 Tax=Orchesella cincta TaxID=48709 RepID=A0A1D2MV28_ORCCI|nr:RNA exonuclease 4 [Orchesella cincta]
MKVEDQLLTMERKEVEVKRKRGAKTEVVVSSRAPDGQLRGEGVVTRSQAKRIEDSKSKPNPKEEGEIKRKPGAGKVSKPAEKTPAPRKAPSRNRKTVSETKVVAPPPLKRKRGPEPSGTEESVPPKKKAKKDDPPVVAAPKKLPSAGLNEFGFFNYTDNGKLLTPITPAHNEFMLDTGIIALDCEMVGVGPTNESALARISIVNEHGWSLYDKFVKPERPVTNYRTTFSGIREADLINATPFQTVKKEVAGLLDGHILVGHSLKHDFAVLYLAHPEARTRDTAEYFQKLLQSRTPALRTLSMDFLGVSIQQGEHSSIVDAQATMALYKLHQKEWELSVSQENGGVDVWKQVYDQFNLPLVLDQIIFILHIFFY